MAEYIERGAALAACCEGCHIYSEEGPCGCEDREAILAIPAADVVEVVRCKDCIFWTGGDYSANCIANGLKTRYANEYCSRGKRRE